MLFHPQVPSAHKANPAMNSPRRNRVACFLSILLGLALRLSPQNEDVSFIHLGRNDGLSATIVYDILQDRNGFMWFATENGLNRFDGYDFTVFRHDPADPASISHSAVLKLYEDRDGTIWASTLNGGLNRYDPRRGEFRSYRHVPDRADSLSNNIVGPILEDRDGAFWIGTDNGLDRLDRTSGKFTRFPLATDRPGAGNHVHDICQDSEGVLWIGTFGGGLIRMDRGTGRFSYFRHDPADPASLSSDFLYRVHEDKEGNFWVCTQAGLNRFDRRSGRFTRITIQPAGRGPAADSQFYALHESRNGLLWFGTSEGLVCMDGRSGAATTYRNDPFDAKSLGADQVLSVYEDRSGILWIGAGNSGIDRFNPNRKKFSHYRAIPGKADSLGSNSIHAFWEDPGRVLWIGTRDGLDRLERGKNAFSHFGYAAGPPGSLGKTNVHCLLGDRSGNLWLGTDGKGLARFDRGSGRVTPFRHDPGDPGSISSDRILALCEDKDGSLWIGTYGGGLNRMDADAKGARFTRYQFDEKDPGSLSDNIVRAILEDSRGTLWIGTYGGGLDRFDRATGKFAHYRHDAADPASLSDDYVYCIHGDTEGAIWVGTLGGGLNKLNREQGTFTHFTQADGLAGNQVLGILEDGSGNLWLMTSEGLSRFSPQAKQFRNYDASDGIQGKGFFSGAVYANQGGEMFIGGANGFNVFSPQNITDNTFVPPLWITSFKILNKEAKLPQPIWETREIVLHPRDQLFSFEFAALDYAAPEKNRYAYKLEGLTDDWIFTDAKRRLASFSLLPPGRYVFRVKASNSDGFWNGKDVSLVIRMRGPWWRSWWFLLLMVLLLSVLLYQWQRSHIRRVAAKIRTEAAMDEMLSKFSVSPREKEIVVLLLKDKTNKEIADQLFIELSTVKIHVHHIFGKLCVRNRAQLLRLFQNLRIK
jgi:ligand-binding sensor domain-containing protein/DNA-binding CsgD family transcriptional regulator